MTLILPGLGTPMNTEGVNKRTGEYWTTIGGRKIYAYSIEALCRTVAYGWQLEKDKMKCIYCGREWYQINEPCNCLLNKGDMGKRLIAMKKLKEIEATNAEKERRKEEHKPKNPSLIKPHGQ